MIIVLIGYMGCGKSTIGAALSKKINYNFFDLDNLIEEFEGKSIGTIFESKGELYFRELEHKILRETLENTSNIVLALGGGTPCYYNNTELYLKNTNVISIYLKTSIQTLFTRLKYQLENRPILKNLNDNELIEFISKHLFERQEYYNKVNFVINNDNENLDNVVFEISNKLF